LPRICFRAARCGPTTETSGGSPSYVELLTCLKMARDARAAGGQDGMSTENQICDRQQSAPFAEFA
jgi:hypothetical protein